MPINPPPASDPLTVVCSICDRPVRVEDAKTDENGKAIHEDCYARKTKLMRSKSKGGANAGSRDPRK